MIQRKHWGFIILLVSLAGLAVWVYGVPAGYQACIDSPARKPYVDYLTGQGYSVECRKETGVDGFFKYRMQTFKQFLGWSETYQISTVYEQPGYFWFLTPAGTLGADGFVFYRYG